MTIEIIKRGELPENRSYEEQCRKCKSILRWLQKDAKRVENDPKNGHFTQIDCPVCGYCVTGDKCPPVAFGTWCRSKDNFYEGELK